MALPSASDLSLNSLSTVYDSPSWDVWTEHLDPEPSRPHSIISTTSTDSDLRSQKLAPHWIEQNFQKRECSQFIPTFKDPNKCGCGRVRSAHLQSAIAAAVGQEGVSQRWTISRHTISLPSDAFGTIEFQGGPHPYKAQYVRLGFDSHPEDILRLFENVWGIKPPKLLITVHGGIANFSLQPKLARVFRKGLLKAAKTTGAWIVTSGINSGVVRHVAAALGDTGTSRSRSKIVTIGIAPWGLLKKRDDLIGKEATVPYHPQALSPKGKFAVLNDRHSFFLLVDNGTIGRYGADIILRKRFEEFISKRAIEAITKGEKRKKIPVVCVVLEGGTCTIRAVLDYVTNSPPVPVVVCDGSGRAADLLAFTHNYILDGGALPDEVKPQLLALVQEVFGYSRSQAEKVILELQLCVRKKHLVTVFRMGEDSQQDVDHAILTALLKGQGDLTAPYQLSLALAWNRVDIARSDIFVLGQDWPPGALENAMMEALLEDRVDFVRLLLENGVSMERFLTSERLEDLYNTDKGPQNTMKYLLPDVVPRIAANHRCTLYQVGLVIQKLIGSAYRCNYCTREFRAKLKKRVENNDRSSEPSRSRIGTARTEDETGSRSDVGEPDFKYPFNELMIWAVLTKRQEMARTMWQHGEEALAKALIACKLYKSMAKEAADDFLEMEICEELKKNSEEFRKLSLELLEHAYNADDELTLQLLTYELKNWGHQTCLSLAVISNNKEFLSHPCCQILLADLWHGGLRIRRNVNWKVLAGLLFPLYIFQLDFKTKEELLLQPQTAEEHAEDIRNDQSSESEGSGSEMEGNDSDLELGTANFADKANGKLSRSSSRASLSSNFVGKFSRQTSKVGGSQGNDISAQRTDPIRRSFDPVHLKRRDSATSGNHRGSRGRRSSTENGVQMGIRSGSIAGSLPNVKTQVGMIMREKKSQNLSVRRKIYEFYVAPITSFWTFTISYLIFLFVFTYMVLVKTPTQPNGPEIFVILYVFTMGLDQIRRDDNLSSIMSKNSVQIEKIIMCEARNLGQKWKIFCQRVWNWTTLLAVLVFIVGLFLRSYPQTLAWGRVVYCSNIIFWYLRLLDILSVNSVLGPYITMVGKMVQNMIYITIILAVMLISFGTARQSILNPNKAFEWLSVRNIFMEPYFMLYGEVYAPSIDKCGDSNFKEGCVTGGWLTPIYMAIFLLVANILLINLLIAVFNSIFQETNAVAHQMWRFQRYGQVMEYESSPSLPPPFIVFSHLYLIFKYCSNRRKTHRQKQAFDLSLKLFLDDEDIEKLHDFEEECMDDLAREKDYRKLVSVEERIKRTADRAEYMSMKITDIAAKESATKGGLVDLERRMENIETEMKVIQNGINETLSLMRRILPSPGETGSSEQTPTITPTEPLQSIMPAPVIATPSNLGIIRENVPSTILLRDKSIEITKSILSEVDEEQRTPETSSPGTTPMSPLSPSMPRQKLRLRRSGPGGGGLKPNLYLSPPATFVTNVTVSNDSDSSCASPNPIHKRGKRSRKRTLTIDDSDSSPNRLMTHRAKSVPAPPPSDADIPVTPHKHSLHTLYSCPPSISRAVGHSPSCRQRWQSSEYSSITDTIVINGAGEGKSIEVQTVSVLESVKENGSATDRELSGGSFVEPDLTSPRYPTQSGDSLKRAKSTFVLKQNEMLRELEETGSRITGGLIEGRIRNQSTSICPASTEDLKDMGLSDFEIKDYLDCLGKGKSSRSSSQDSLSSRILETEEGFNQINECLMEKEHSQSSGMTDIRFEPVPDFKHSSARTTPVVSPGTKAGQIFTFDAQDLTDYFQQVVDEEEKTNDDGDPDE